MPRACLVFSSCCSSFFLALLLLFVPTMLVRLVFLMLGCSRVRFFVIVLLLLSHAWHRCFSVQGLPIQVYAEKRQLVGQRSVCHIPPKGLIARGEESEERGGTM